MYYCVRTRNDDVKVCEVCHSVGICVDDGLIRVTTVRVIIIIIIIIIVIIVNDRKMVKGKMKR